MYTALYDNAKLIYLIISNKIIQLEKYLAYLLLL